MVAVLTLALGTGMAPAQPTEPPMKLVAFGDSLTAGYQLPPDKSFPAQLERALASKGVRVKVLNAGVSGDTTAAGLDRLDWAVPGDAAAVIVELGANDALRGLDPRRARDNLDRILSGLKARGLPVLLAGMRAPRNMGEAYTAAFDGIYAELAARHGTLLYPFFLDGIALDPKFNLADGIHPNAEGVAEIVRRILPSVEALLAEVSKRKAQR